MGKFIIKECKTGFTFSLKARNGQVIATGGEVFNTLKSVNNSIASVTRNAPVANIEDQTVEGFEKAKCPKFEIYTDKSGEYRFRLKATNGEPILASEGYKAKTSCFKGIASVQKNVDGAAVIQPVAEN